MSIGGSSKRTSHPNMGLNDIMMSMPMNWSVNLLQTKYGNQEKYYPVIKKEGTEVLKSYKLHEYCIYTMVQIPHRNAASAHFLVINKGDRTAICMPKLWEISL